MSVMYITKAKPRPYPCQAPTRLRHGGRLFAHVRNRGYIQLVSASKRTADKSAKTTEWLVYRLGGPRAAFLGHVTAPNRETALARAYDEFHIVGDAERKRIIVLETSRT